ncbi:MAG: AMP-binding protein [Treponema sp.]|nr:AMP-binding protein [Treponema sp.]
MINSEKYTLGTLALAAAEKYGKKTAFQIFHDNGVYDRLSYAEFGIRVRRFASYLKGHGIKTGDRVMILAENRPEWPIAFFGIALVGAISVPVLTDFVEEQIRVIAAHSEISAICVTERTAAKAEWLRGSLPFFVLDDADLFKELAHSEIVTESISKNDPSVIIYTSGTTGSSKGVVLSHENLIFTATAARSIMKIYPRDRLLSVIPLAHSYECTLGLLTPLMSGASITYLDKPPSPAVLIPAMQNLRPTAIVGVPLFLEKIYRNSIFPSLEKNILYKLKPTRSIAIKLAGAGLMAAMGSALRFFGIGGAPLAEDVEVFLRKAGFPYSPGYGLTETSPLVAGTAPYRFAFRSSGKMIPGISIRISDEGEVQVQGPNVMQGYYHDEERSKGAFTDDGWLKTGDLGYMDKKNHLFLRGRIKAMILGPSGENIYPEEIENLLNTSGMVEDSLVQSGPRGELVAFIVLSEKAQTAIAALADNMEELKQNVNKRLAAFSRLSRIEIQKEPFEKTPTRKIKRFLYTNLGSGELGVGSRG